MSQDSEKIAAQIERLTRDHQQDEIYRRKLKDKAEMAVVWARMKENAAERERLVAQLGAIGKLS